MKDIKTSTTWGHFFAYVLCLVAGGLIAAIPRFMRGFEHETGSLVLISEILRIPITILLLYWYTKYVVKIELNWPTLNWKSLNIVLWLLVGLALPIMTIALFYVTGNLTIEYINTESNQSNILDSISKSLGMSLAAGVVEEVVFRGYIFNLLRTKYNFWIAAFAPSLLFTLFHIGAAGSLLNVFQLLVAGLLVSFMFVAIYVYTKSIWNCSIVHFLWNFIILNELVSFGNKEASDALVRFDIGDNQIFNGGDFGIETSIPAIIVYALTLAIIWRFYKKKNAAISKIIPKGKHL